MSNLRDPITVLEAILRTLRSDDGDRSEDVKKVIELITKTTILHVHHAILYISLSPLHDYDVKMPEHALQDQRTRKTALTQNR